jgi:hypothetical protein
LLEELQPRAFGREIAKVSVVPPLERQPLSELLVVGHVLILKPGGDPSILLIVLQRDRPRNLVKDRSLSDCKAEPLLPHQPVQIIGGGPGNARLQLDSRIG